MTQILRKTCTQCGEQNLAVDWRCWACGAALIAPAAGAGGMATVMHAAPGGDAPTMMPVAPRGEMPRGMPVAFAGGRTVAAVMGLGVLLLGVSVGWLLSRWASDLPRERDVPTATAPLIPGPRAYAPQPAAPIQLPPPGTRRPAPTSSPWPSAPTPPPARPYARPGGGSSRFAGPPQGTFPPGWHALPTRPARGAAMRQSGTPMASRPSGSEVPAARPASGTAGDRPTLRIRNAARVPVDYVLEGPEPQGGRLAPGTEIPLPLPPGHYRLTLTDGGRPKPQDLVLRPGQDHSVVFP